MKIFIPSALFIAIVVASVYFMDKLQYARMINDSITGTDTVLFMTDRNNGIVRLESDAYISGMVNGKMKHMSIYNLLK